MAQMNFFGLTGPVTGHVTGPVTGPVTGHVTGHVTGLYSANFPLYRLPHLNPRIPQST